MALIFCIYQVLVYTKQAQKGHEQIKSNCKGCEADSIDVLDNSRKTTLSRNTLEDL